MILLMVISALQIGNLYFSIMLWSIIISGPEIILMQAETIFSSLMEHSITLEAIKIEAAAWYALSNWR